MCWYISDNIRGTLVELLMIKTLSHKCSCVTATNANLSCGPDGNISAWGEDGLVAPAVGRHIAGHPGYLDCFARGLKYSASTPDSNNSKPSSTKSFLRMKPVVNEYKFSHLEPEEYMVSYKKTCCSVSSDEALCTTGSTSRSQPIEQLNTPSVNLIGESSFSTKSTYYRNTMTKPAVLHEINLVVPSTVMHHRPKLLRPTPPDLWYSASSTVDSVFQVKGSGLTSNEAISSTPSPTSYHCPTTTIKHMTLRHKPTVYVDFTDRLKSLDEYPVYGTVPFDDISLHDVVPQKNPSKKKKRYYHLPNKVNPIKSMEEGFNKLCISRPNEVHSANPGRLLAGKIRSKSDAGCSTADSESNISSTLMGKKMKTSVVDLDNTESVTVREKVSSGKKDSISAPNLFQVCVRQPIQPPVLNYPNADPFLIVGNPELFKEVADSDTNKPSASNNKIKYRINLNAHEKDSKPRWRRERRSSCFKRSSQRRSRKWLFLNDVGELQHIMVREPASILDDIINAE